MAHSGPKKMRCHSWQRVSGRQGRVLRCKRYTRSWRRRGHPSAIRGAHCAVRKLVFSPFLNKQVERCARFALARPTLHTPLFSAPSAAPAALMRPRRPSARAAIQAQAPRQELYISPALERLRKQMQTLPVRYGSLPLRQSRPSARYGR